MDKEGGDGDVKSENGGVMYREAGDEEGDGR